MQIRNLKKIIYISATRSVEFKYCFSYTSIISETFLLAENVGLKFISTYPIIIISHDSPLCDYIDNIFDANSYVCVTNSRTPSTCGSLSCCINAYDDSFVDTFESTRSSLMLNEDDISMNLLVVDLDSVFDFTPESYIIRDVTNTHDLLWQLYPRQLYRCILQNFVIHVNDNQDENIIQLLSESLEIHLLTPESAVVQFNMSITFDCAECSIQGFIDLFTYEYVYGITINFINGTTVDVDSVSFGYYSTPEPVYLSLTADDTIDPIRKEFLSNIVSQYTNWYLHYLYLSGIHITGDIYLVTENLIVISVIDCVEESSTLTTTVGNLFYNTLPNMIRFLEIVRTPLNMHFPFDIKGCYLLQTLILQEIGLIGSIPFDQLAKLEYLVNFDVSKNPELGGDLTVEFLDREFDVIFDISQTLITGTIEVGSKVCDVKEGYVCRLNELVVWPGEEDCPACTVAA